ncbi:MAG: FAD-binding oxidoreductase [Scytolyngbya sp. HA4215-MV1]|jgi:glycine/D-amino acid oxidase-like deaminating enzyme|nr:FAD-binding oxidoreductase [Scytolyngbya sp. HA4215-MV1]
MKTYDWIVVGAGITGLALAYELAKQGFVVLQVEQHAKLQGATRFGYGGIGYWAGTTDLTRQLCAEGIARHRGLSDELGHCTQFRELDLVLTIAPDQDPAAIAATYQTVALSPHWLSGSEACVLEPLLNPAAIAGAFTVKHGHIDLSATAQAYQQAIQRFGGTRVVEPMVDLIQVDDRITGIITPHHTYEANCVAICTGGISRALLKAAGVSVPLYFTHAELIETPPVDLSLRTLVMPATTQRFQLEQDATQVDALWDEPGHEPAPPILDAGAIQFLDGSLRMGQISRALTDPNAKIDPVQSEAEIRTSIGKVLPDLQNLPGTWHHCLIGFSRDTLPLVGAIPRKLGLFVFSGFSNPLAIVPAIAQRFAIQATGQADALIEQLSPIRFR